MGEMIWNKLAPELKKRRVVHHVYLTSKRKHAEKIAARITGDDKEHTIVVLGGDGTVNEVINGIKNPEKVTLGYIPIGSSNDFARGLGISKDPEKALEAVLCPEKIISMDVGAIAAGCTGGEAEQTDEREARSSAGGSRAKPERKPRGRRFAVSAGMGFDAAVCHEVCVSPWKVFLNKIGLGKLSYAVVALDRLKKDRPARMTLTLPDGSSKVFERAYFAVFMNLRYEGGGFKFCPDASCEDGLLDVLIVHSLCPLQLVLLLTIAIPGRHVKFRSKAVVLRCRSCTVETETPMPLHMDGEPGYPRRSASVWIMKEKLRVIVG